VPYAAATVASLQAVRAQAPLIHNITNLVAMETSANVLLALGASPVMAHAEEEVGELVPRAAALVINIGTLSPPWIPAMERAVRAALDHGRPWVLDPVGAAATSHRCALGARLAGLGPSVLRANASEILALAGSAGTDGGVDSRHAIDDALAAAGELAGRWRCVVAVTGEIDHVTDGHRWLGVRNGDPRMTRVTALGCAASATVAAFLAVEPDPLLAAAEALALFGLAGERAAARARGPGSLKVELLDELAALDERTVHAGVRITEP